MLKNLSYRLGLVVGGNPCTFVFTGLMLLAFCLMGLVNIQITDDPQELWVPPTSRANLEQDYFKEKFGPFFRINTLWLTPGPGLDEQSDVFDQPYLQMLHMLQDTIEQASTNVAGIDYRLDDFCYKPISGKGCIITSPMEYWKMNVTNLKADEDVKVTAQCIAPPDATERVCFDRIGVPVLQFAIFGGLSCVVEKKNDCSECLVKASGLQATFLLYNNEYTSGTAEAWERDVFIRNIRSFNKALGNGYHDEEYMDVPLNQTFIDELQKLKTELSVDHTDMYMLKADYLAERSIPDNISEEASENTFVAVASYILMFFYVGSAIGHLPSVVHSKFSLGFSGIFVVLSALGSSFGILSYLNQKLTMISVEVVPFLILAIGVDNMFLISRAERVIPKEITDPKERIALAMREIGPSIFVAAFCEALAFFIGQRTDIPALRSFCMVAGIAVLTDFVYQITIFLPALYFDRKRIQQNRCDIFCCVKASKQKPVREDFIRRLFNNYYVPWVFQKPTKIMAILATIGLIIISCFSTVKITRGLNQNVTLVSGSDIYDYFDTLQLYGDAGPPGYVVFNNVDYQNQTNLEQMELIDAELAALNNTILSPIYSWVTPFKNFLSDGEQKETCGSAAALKLSFDDQVRAFTNIKVTSQCCQKFGICGEQYSLDIVFNDEGNVDTTRFRFMHKPMKSQEDYIAGLVETRKATDIFASRLTQVKKNKIDQDPSPDVDKLTSSQTSFGSKLMRKLASVSGGLLRDSDHKYTPTDLEAVEKQSPVVFCYSLYYVYYDQYTYITGILAQDVLIGLISIFVAIQILSSIQISVFIVFSVFLVFFELMGTMWMLNIIFGGFEIEMNGILVVNLVTSLGFGVEFCNHIAMNFMKQTGTRNERAQKALSEMGSSVLVGITFTKFIGVVVLSFASSTLFKLYYFRMYLFIIILGAFNGLMVLPVLLSLIGPMPDVNELLDDYKHHKMVQNLIKKFENEKKYDGERNQQ